MILHNGTFDEQRGISSVETSVGTLTFSDTNGHYKIDVNTSGEFWRVVEIWPGTLPALPPEAARQLARLLFRAARQCEAEREALRWPKEDHTVGVVDHLP